jgi:hypothetical protein
MTVCDSKVGVSNLHKKSSLWLSVEIVVLCSIHCHSEVTLTIEESGGIVSPGCIVYNSKQEIFLFLID